ncbi:ArsR/SmtB family transcription factor [Actinokineospora sp. HUAS TT18]|uniref:ArsR/SmtB family transcription factor n=1 Tax=Actinokineospora sp. HUAS TT18 TaxID=3447451 RepID=UPI003F52409F
MADAQLNALGDANRRAILRLLTDGPRSVQDISDALPISRPAVSRHLKLLRAAGLVAEERHGTRRLHKLHNLGVKTLRGYLDDVWGADRS